MLSAVAVERFPTGVRVLRHAPIVSAHCLSNAWMTGNPDRTRKWRDYVRIAHDPGVGDLAQSRMNANARQGLAKALTLLSALERSQKIDDFLLLLGAQLIEILDDPVCFATTALVSSDGFNQAVGPPVMEEEDTLSDAP